MLRDKSQGSPQISPIDLIGSPIIYTYIPTPNPIIIGKRSIAFQNVITINIEELKMMAKDNKPGILLNEHGEMPIHVTMEDGTLYTSRPACIEEATRINANVLLELQEIRDRKTVECEILIAECGEYDTAIKMLDGVVKHMK